MELFKIFFFLIILFELACAGCVSYSSNPVVEDAKDTHAIIGPDYRNQGKGSFVCGKGEMRFSREVIQQTILVLTTAFLLWQTGIDANGETWWHDSKQNYKTLIDAGYIKKPINDETGFN